MAAILRHNESLRCCDSCTISTVRSYSALGPSLYQFSCSESSTFFPSGSSTLNSSVPGSYTPSSSNPNSSSPCSSPACDSFSVFSSSLPSVRGKFVHNLSADWTPLSLSSFLNNSSLVSFLDNNANLNPDPEAGSVSC